MDLEGQDTEDDLNESSYEPVQDEATESVSTLERRMSLFMEDTEYVTWKEADDESKTASGNITVPRDSLLAFGSKIACLDCLILAVPTCQSLDMDYSLSATCPNCGTLIASFIPEEKTRKSLRPHTAGLVQSCIDSGTGYAGFQKYVQGANMDSTMSNKRYYVYAKELGEAMKSMYNKQRPIVNKAVRAKYFSSEGIVPDGDGILNVAVSYDGSWLTRGHRSNIGAGFVIDCSTGCVLDYEVKSKFCQRCALLKTKYKDDVDKLCEQLDVHKLSGECHRNYEGASGGMEKQIALDLWNRSIQTNNMRYTTFVSDSDSSAYNAVKDAASYGDLGIEKQECINHVSKRLCTKLRMLKKTTAVPKTTATGKTRQMSTLGGQGKLTDKVIDKLSGYFSKNIRDNKGKSVETMKKDILASYDHVTSSDVHPLHDRCPEGKKSRCFVKKAEACGESPPSHSTMQVKCELMEKDRDVVRKVYEELCNDALLLRCLSGKTQNPNESFHSKVWTKLPKIKAYSLPTVYNTTARTVVEHNLGFEGSYLLSSIGFSNISSGASQHTRANRQKERIRHAKDSITKRKTKRNRSDPGEDDPDYGAGQH